MAETLIRQGGATRFTQAVASLAASAGDRARLAELTPPGQINLRGRPSDPRFVRTVGAVLGCVLPLNANTVTSAAEVTVLWLGPDEWLLVTNPGEETALIGRLREALGDIHAAVTDVTGNRTRLRLSGPGARETLMKGCSLDLHPRELPPRPVRPDPAGPWRHHPAPDRRRPHIRHLPAPLLLRIYVDVAERRGGGIPALEILSYQRGRPCR